MSATEGFSAGGAEGAEASKKRVRGRPPGTSKKAKTEAMVSPSAPRRHGRPLGSKNKKMLAAAALTAPSVAAATASPSWLLSELPPVLQPPAYSSVDGYVTFIIPVLAGCGDRLRLPSKFVEAMEGQVPARVQRRPADARDRGSRSTTMARGSATSVMDGQSSSRSTVCRSDSFSSSPIATRCGSSLSTSSTAPTAPAPSLLGCDAHALASMVCLSTWILSTEDP
jgi:hypothetical protein